MERSLLVKVITALNKKKRAQLDSFLSIGLFNRGKHAEDVVKLLKLVDIFLKAPRKESIAKAHVFNKIYPDQKFHLGQLEKLMSRLLNLVYQFIHISADDLESDEIKKEISIYRFLMKNGLAQAGKTRENLIANQLKVANSNADTFLQALMFQKSITEFQNFQSNRNVDYNLPENLKSLDRFYLFRKLELTLQLLTVNLWISPVEINDAIKKMNQALKSTPLLFEEDQVFDLYLMAYKLLINFGNIDASAFQAFQQKLFDYKDYCHPNQLKAFQTLSRNYCISTYKQGKASFIDVSYDLYRKHLKDGLLYHNNKILIGTLCNLVLLASWKKDFEWARKFIDNHQELISGVDAGATVRDYNLAVIAFYEKTFHQSLALLAPIYNDRYLKIASKRLEIMALFELESDLIGHRLEAFKIFVYRLDLDQNLLRTKDQNKNFVGILKQIIHPKTKNNSLRIEKLVVKIDKTLDLAERIWLRDKTLEKR